MTNTQQHCFFFWHQHIFPQLGGAVVSVVNPITTWGEQVLKMHKLSLCFPCQSNQVQSQSLQVDFRHCLNVGASVCLGHVRQIRGWHFFRRTSSVFQQHMRNYCRHGASRESGEKLDFLKLRLRGMEKVHFHSIVAEITSAAHLV